MKEQLPIQRVAVIAHPDVPASTEEAVRVCELLGEYGVEAVHSHLSDPALQKQVAGKAVDLVITLGGDGTVLRAGHLCAPSDIPILPINFGRFGFLIEVASDQWPQVLPTVFSGDYWFEVRMMLRLEQKRDGEVLSAWDVLNEAFVGRGELVRPVHLVTDLDGEYLTTYVADGLIVSTATGSTAYALAAGGPILPPEMRNILLIPVAPHLSVDRPIVLAEGAEVSVTVRTGHEAALSADGRPTIHLQDGDRITVCASKYNLRFMRFQDPDYFYRQLFPFMDHNPSAGIAK